MKFLSKAQIIGIVILCVIAIAVVLGTPTLPQSGKIAIIVFLSAIYAWSMTKIDATLVALIASLIMSVSVAGSDKNILAALGDPFIGFVIAGFILGGAYKASGLSERIAKWFAAHSHKVSSLFYLLTTALLVLSFVVPSTSARAAMLMPVYLGVTSTIDNANVRKSLAILFPTIIVLSCVTSYLGAGANLMTADFIEKFAGKRISYSEWFFLGAPFGVASCYLSTSVILNIFLNKNERNMPFKLTIEEKQMTSETINAQKKTLIVTAILILCWMTEQWHGIDAGKIAMTGAIALCLPQFGILNFKQALKEVEWSLIIFMAATIQLSQGLAESGAVKYLTDSLAVATTSLNGIYSLVAILTIALLSHLVIHSRTARAAVMMPILIPMGIAAGFSGLLTAFFVNAAMGYCLTLPVCAKPVAMFSTAGEEGYTTKDLLKLSMWLLPLHLVLLLLAWAVYSV